jgi:predicted Na+-dependent transporter
MYPLAAIPGAIFSVWHNISGGIMARIYSRRSELEVIKSKKILS